MQHKRNFSQRNEAESFSQSPLKYANANNSTPVLFPILATHSR